MERSIGLIVESDISLMWCLKAGPKYAVIAIIVTG